MPTPDPRIAITFAKQAGPSLTHWIELEAPVGAEPTGLFADLRAAGWIESHSALPAHMAYGGRPAKPLGYSVIERSFSKPGTNLFKSWSAAESKLFLSGARAILRKHGFERVPVWRKTMQDMM